MFQPSLTGRALRLLSSREHSRLELERKLSPFEEEPGALALVLDALQAKGFINEARVLASVLHRRAAKRGTALVRQELQSKGLAPEAVREAVSQLSATEVERAAEVWHKKFGEPAASPQEVARQMRFLASRGFSTDAIRRVVASKTDAPFKEAFSDE